MSRGASPSATGPAPQGAEPQDASQAKPLVPCAFTPGPWEAHRYATEYYKGPAGADPAAITLADDGLILAVAIPDCFPNVEANARLIAAAPELYEALETLFAVTVSLKFERGDGPPIASDAAYDKALAATRAALAKARGQ